MSMKKKLGSKLSEGVRQVKSQREPVPANTPAKTAPVAKPAAQTTPARPANKPASLPTNTPSASAPGVTNLNKLHPLRVWPD